MRVTDVSSKTTTEIGRAKGVLFIARHSRMSHAEIADPESLVLLVTAGQ